MPDRTRLRAIDAVWLELDHGGPPVAIGSVSLCDGPAPTIRELRGLVRERLALMPRLAQRPDGDHAWVPADLDLEQHVRRVRLRSGTRAALDAYVGRLMAEPLDPAHPLWALRLVSGLDGGDWALVWRLHHSIADGLGALLLAGHVYDTSRDGGVTLPQAVLAAAENGRSNRPTRPEPSGRLDRLGHLGSRLATGTLHAAGATMAALPHVLEAARTTVPMPPSALTGELGPERRWHSTELPLTEVKRVGRGHGGTVNDVVVSLATAGFRALLLSQGYDLVPGQPVRCLLPVSLRPPGDAGAENQVSALLGQLPVWIEDPRERLHAVIAHLDDLKRSRGYLAVPALLDLVDRTVPAGLQELAVGRLGDAVTPWYMDAVVTNVPGPQFPLWVLGRRVRSMHPTIPVAAHIRTTIGVLSYDGMLDVGVTAAVGGGGGGGGGGEDDPDVAVLADAMVTELAVLGRLAR